MSDKTPKQPMDHLRSRKKPMTKTVQIIGDSEAMDRLEAARLQLQGFLSMAQARGQEPESEELARLDAAQMAAEQEVRDSTITFRFQSIGRKRYEALLMEHPPTAEQKAEALAEHEKDPANEKDLPFNPDTFPMALVHASMVEPAGLTFEQVDEWLNGDEWNGTEFFELWMTALAVNNIRRTGDIPKG